ncbi:DUF2705 family protein [Bacillus sp. NTK074B]|uniref:DUF2705 family protein n=1 Tax=Bacillus sp. NTK074B TaxID=2802174 RepID=UPI0034A0BF4B
MFKSHIHRIAINKKSILALLLILTIPMLEIMQLLHYQSNSEMVFHPAFAFFLSASSIGHAPQIILFWFLPIYFLLLGSDDAIQDKKTGYRNILISKIGKRNYYLEKLGTSFIISFTVMAVSLFLNFILVSFIFRKGTFSKGILEMDQEAGTLMSFSADHPYSAVLLFTVITCVFAGSAGLLGASMSLFFQDAKYVYPASFFIWFLFVLRENSIVYLFQPFAEYDWNVLLPILYIALVVFIMIPIIVSILGIKYHED